MALTAEHGLAQLGVVTEKKFEHEALERGILTREKIDKLYRELA